MGVLRFLLALAVVLAHSGPISGFLLVGGELAVKAFYIISGFYMTLILTEKYSALNNSYYLFISNRFLRLFPVYWIVLLFTVLYSIGLSRITNGENMGYFNFYAAHLDGMGIDTLVFLIFTNIFLFFQDIVMFLGMDAGGNLFFTENFRETSPMLFNFLFVPQAWTIGLELTFYIIAPFLVKRKPALIVVLIMASLLVRFALHKNGLSGDPWSYRFFPSELAFFLMGIIAYHIYKKVQSIKVNSSYASAMLIFIVAFTLSYSFLSFPGKYTIYILAVFICIPFIFILTKTWKYDSYIGELSYPMYISHILVLKGIGLLNIPLVGGIGLTLAVSTVVFSILLNELVAKKVERIRHKRVAQTTIS